MQFEHLLPADLPYLHEFEPPGWGDLVPRFSYALASSFCHPYKMTIEGRMVAVGTIILHRDTAWLASIIVHPGERNKGYGGWITKRLIEAVGSPHRNTIYLDATELGYPVYKKLGFELETTYAHFRSIEKINGLVLSTNIYPFKTEWERTLFDLDRQVSGEDRRDTLEEHLNAVKVYSNRNKATGFYFPSLGNGLIIAADKHAGIELVKYRLEKNDYAILPSTNEAGMSFLSEAGLTQFRVSRRMFLGMKREWYARAGL